MILNKCLVLTFDSHYSAIKAKKCLGESEHFSLSPTPRIISSSCATSLLGDESVLNDYEKNKALYLSLTGLEGLYIIENGKKETLYER